MLVFLAKLIGLAVTGLGLAIFISPGFTQRIFDLMKEGKRIYWAGVARCLIGLILILVASKSALPVAAVSVGMTLLLSGIIVFACDLEKLKAFLARYSELPVLVVRLLGLVAAFFGVLIFSVI